MFPQLIAGPIVRYSDLADQLKERPHSWGMAAEGIRRFMIGLGKKVLLANQMGELCAAFQASGEKTVLFHWIYAVALCLQIYFDFSGYSDMALGLGRVFGFRFPENFNYTYISAILETLAYVAGHLVQRLCVHSLGRKSGGKDEAPFQHSGGMDAYRLLAWGRLELCSMGITVCPAADP